MTRAAAAFLTLISFSSVSLLLPQAAHAFTREVREGSDLQYAIDSAGDGDTLRIPAGTFDAIPEAYADPLCGNCLEHRMAVKATRGFHVDGKSLAIIGAGPDRTVLRTHAGYGVYFENAGSGTLRSLCITDGMRDPDGNATDAAVVVRSSRVLLEDLLIRDNGDRAAGVIVGIAGIVGREGSELTVRRCRIHNNGWDGIALYRGARAEITDNVIEGGRGAGIGVTWDGAASVIRNRVSRYWKGIGAFGQSRVIARNNAVFDNLGWGIIATGESFLEALHNVIVRNGNCGLAVWSESATGLASNNVIVDNGWRQEWVCPRVGIWHAGFLDHFDVRFNNVDGNAQGDWKSETGENPPASLVRGDPGFPGPEDFRLPLGSFLVDAGDSTRTDADGTPSDIGLGGGPCATPDLGAPPRRLPAERLRIGSVAWSKQRMRKVGSGGVR